MYLHQKKIVHTLHTTEKFNGFQSLYRDRNPHTYRSNEKNLFHYFLFTSLLKATTVSILVNLYHNLCRTQPKRIENNDD